MDKLCMKNPRLKNAIVDILAVSASCWIVVLLSYILYEWLARMSWSAEWIGFVLIRLIVLAVYVGMATSIAVFVILILARKEW